MGRYSEEKKQDVFKDQLYHLWKNGYLTEMEYKRVLEANRTYIHTINLPEEQEETLPSTTVSEPVRELVKTNEPPKPEKKKKVKSAEKIRERNITWSLILGVSLLLITGLIVATSQWEQMGAGMKVFSILFVAFFFLGLSYGTGRFLKIKQTAFAFLTLGSLLLPIAIVAIGYFELFGSYLSLFGEGRYLLGLFGTLLPLPLFIRNALAHQSRLFVWISYVFLSLAAGFAAGALPLTVDAFYFVLMVYNAVLLVLYTKWKNRDNGSLFIKELPLFAQLNLILSTMLLLFFFENEVFYSFNLLLTASIYMAMVFVYRTKEYQFVFSVMTMYAIYQLVEHSPLQSVGVTVYALAGLVYLGFAYAFKNHAFIEKVFRYTSGVVSFCAFGYISYQGFVLKGEDYSWVLLAAYIVITANYLLLAGLTQYVVFQSMTSVFYFVALWQLWGLTQLGPLFFFLYLGACFAFVYIGVWTKNRWLRSIQNSTFYTSLLVIAGCIWYGLYEAQYGWSAFMLAVVSVLAYLTKRRIGREDIEKTTVWVNPVALLTASVVFYEPLSHWLPDYEEGLSFPFHLAITGILLIALHLGWKRVKELALSVSTFYVGQGAYIAAMVILLNNPQVDPIFVRPLLLVVGIGMMYGLVQFSKQKAWWLAVSLVALGFYVSLIDPLSIESFASFIFYMLFAPVLLVLAGEIGERKWRGMRPCFYWVGHVVQPLLVLLFLFDQIGANPVHPLMLLVPLSLYLYSSIVGKREWEIKAMLYLGLSVLFLIVLALPNYYDWFASVPSVYGFLITSLGLAGIWAGLPIVWKKRLEWYWIPFSILGLFMIISRPSSMANVEVIPVLGYVLLILFFLHRRGWTIVQFAPLLLTIDLWETINVEWEQTIVIAVLISCILVLIAVGRFFHEYLVGAKVRVDAYSWTAVVYIVYLNSYTMGDPNVWIRILPILFIGGWLIVNAPKWEEPLVSKTFISAGSGCMYTAYIFALQEYQTTLPDLIHAELEVLPFLILLLYLRKRTWQEYKSAMNYVQLAVVLFIAAYLVVDAIQSHTIWDAWIIGGLSLLSMVAGMQWKIKSYFFVGMGVLIFNVLYQTRPYWGHVPWWVYLLLAGLILIGIASYNEWQKQQSGKNNPVERKLKRLWLNLKKWN